MGQDKALLPYKENVWLFEQAKQIQQSESIQKLVIVCQPVKKEAYQKALQTLRAENFDVQFVINPDPMSKPSDSIRCALKEFNFEAGAFVSPIDVPLRSDVIQTIQKAQGSKVKRPTHQNRPGHPVWIAGDLLKSFASEATRLDDFLRGFVSEESNIEVSSPEILLNLNTPELWEAFTKG